MPTLSRNLAIPILFTCPSTGKAVPVGLSALDEADYEAMRRNGFSGAPITCPECRGDHVWTAEQTFLDDLRRQVESIVDLANRSTNSSGLPDAALSLQRMEAVDQCCKRGASARLDALSQCCRIRDSLAQRAVIVELVTGGTPVSRHGSIHGPALEYLSNSSKPELLELLAEHARVFARALPRNEFKRAFVAARRNADPLVREHLEYALRSNGFRKLFGIWL